MATAGYSGTPLFTKLGIKPGVRAQFISAPVDVLRTLGALPGGIRLSARGPLGFALLFVRRKSILEKQFARVRDRLDPDGMLWVAWPKKTSGVQSDLSESVVREIGLQNGLVDVKVCAVDETWSGLKFVRRLRDR
ncbi:MAG: DUF3052 domain-containing protein [Gemmatimonadaceae bacterium]